MSVRHSLPMLVAATLLCLVAGQPVAVAAPPQSGPWPRRVLITNGNGIHATRIWALAQAFARHNDTWDAIPALRKRLDQLPPLSAKH